MTKVKDKDILLHSIQSVAFVRAAVLLISILVASAVVASAQVLPLGANVQASTVDSAGNIYVAGHVHTPNLPATPGSFQPHPAIDCSSDPFCGYGFAAKVAPSGDKLLWATYLGGGGMDSPTTLALAPDGSIYVAGSNARSFLPPLDGYQSTPSGLFLARLSADGSSLRSASYFGGPGTTYAVGGSQADSIAAIRVDSAGNVYIAGNANSIPLPTTASAYQRERSSVKRDPCS